MTIEMREKQCKSGSFVKKISKNSLECLQSAAKNDELKRDKRITIKLK